MLNQADQGNKQNTEGRRLRQPSSSMMIGQVGILLERLTFNIHEDDATVLFSFLISFMSYTYT